MKILHSADWHLGHELHGYDRSREQGAFLSWLGQTLIEQEVDALIVAGDLFDTVNPSASAQKQLYRFIEEVHGRLPHLQTVLLGGNHDSAGRLEAPTPLLRAFGVHVVGRLPRQGDEPDWSRLLIPLRDRQGRERVMVAAIPYLRPADRLPAFRPAFRSERGEEGNPWLEGMRWIYRQAVEQANRRRTPDTGLILTGHCHLKGGELSALSERRILSGGEEALPVEIFPPEADYVALGHLHRGQSVAGRETVRYAGSPYPLSVTERDYRHGVRLTLWDDVGRLVDQTSLPVPRAVAYLRVPDRDALPLAEVLTALETLDLSGVPTDPDRHPFLEVVVRLTGPEPGLRVKIEQVLVGKPVRLAAIQTDLPGQQRALASVTDAQTLNDIQPQDVFRLLHRETYGQEPDIALLRAFDDVLETCLNPAEPRS